MSLRELCRRMRCAQPDPATQNSSTRKLVLSLFRRRGEDNPAESCPSPTIRTWIVFVDAIWAATAKGSYLSLVNSSSDG